MEKDPVISTLSPDQRADDPVIGSSVGRFVIEDRLGAGGMGVVYAAYDPRLGRRVAVKILRGARAGATAGERLLREAQAMARLMHPNVAVVFDAGTVGDRLFVAMELVDGQSLDVWLRAGGHGWREVLDCFVRAGRGLSAAHAAGIVHRDFKPANVLVGTDGRIRVTDFGLARSEGEWTEVSGGAQSPDGPLTETGAVLGTPAYMAPEQRRGERASVLADQYSFCVALHEGLFGFRPAVGAAPRRSPVSARVKRVLARGLAEKPEARWPSMDALLDGLAAATSRPARWALAGAAVVAILAAAVLVRTANRPGPCAGLEARLDGIWDAGRKDTIHAAFLATGLPYADERWQTVSSLTDRYAASWVEQAGAVCRARGHASTDTAQRQACLDQRLDSLRAWSGVYAVATVPAVKNAVAAASAHPDLGSCQDPVPDARPLPSEPVLAAEVRNLRQQLGAAATRLHAGEPRLARAEVGPVLAAARALGFRPLEAEADALMVDVSGDTADVEEIDALVTAEAQIAEETRDDALRAAAWAQRVSLLAHQHRPAEAHRAARYADAILAPMSGRRSEQTAIGLLYAEADAYEAENDYAQATMLTNAAVARAERLFGPDDVRVARRLMGLAYDLHGLGSLDEAERTYRRTLALVRAANGDHHALVPMIEANLAALHNDEHDHAGALELDTLAQAHMEDVFGPTHVYSAENLVGTARTLLHLGRTADALVALGRAQQILESRLDPKSDEIADLWATLGWALVENGAASAAVEVLEKALAIRLENKASGDAVAEVRFNLARALGSDAPRARQLAEAARAGFGSAHADERAAVDAWLARPAARRRAH